MSHNECPQKSSFFVQKFTFHTNDTACNNVFALVLFSTRCRKTRDKSPVLSSFRFSKHSSIESENKTNDAKDSRIPQDLVNLTVIQKKGRKKFFPIF